ncbi:HNH endonuclease [Streptomyces sudanensis]|uniref:HNH endonuclease signature motif containing protein n=1 Tax=Streptomyces sudanensis TaxID=436397 RepID=UPI0020CBCB48|nr:HNH endonuclease signature motif containing protein [Streptomyces sudanensis]MCP9986902.1 HNH endonuclease [Streptomyces sudanensis]
MASDEMVLLALGEVARIMDRRDVIGRIGKLKPAQRSTGRAPHRPILLLWAIGQALQGKPRQQHWSDVSEATSDLLARYASVRNDRQAALNPFWALRGDGLWEIEGSEALALTSKGRRPLVSSLDSMNPLGGLPKQVYDSFVRDPELAAWAVESLLLRFFTPAPAGLLEDLGLTALMAGREATALRPLVGETYPDRRTIADAYGGNRVCGITPLGDGILAAFSDDKGPYADGRIPETDWIAYTGDGLSGDQKLVAGNKSMALYQEERRALRYWHRPYRGQWRFETWAVIIQRWLRWGRGEDGLPRREYVWVLAPVPSPLRETWPKEILEVLAEDTGRLHDYTADITIAAGVESRKQQLDDRERYERLARKARELAAGRSQPSTLTKVERFLRSPAARAAVLLRSGGRCENPSCLGHPLERTDADAPLLEVDHVRDLARGGLDSPESMIALCPNCHALKTRGRSRHQLQQILLAEARRRHEAFLG